jgi:hypothetical protein
MQGFDRIFRGLASGAAVAVLAAAVSAPALGQTAPIPTSATLVAPTLPRPVALTVTWPKVSEVERLDGNGVSFYGGVASIDGSDQYGLSVLTFDPFQSSVRATYIDAWALNAPNAASCSLTFRAVERALTQEQANALAPELATAELQTIQRDHPDLVKSGDRTREGTDVSRVVDRFSWDQNGVRFDGLSKSWVFVRLGHAYYVNKICLSQTGMGDLVVMDQLIGLNYRAGDAAAPTPGDVVPENPPAPRRLIYLPPPVGNIAVRDQDQQALESQTLGNGDPALAPAPAPPPAAAPEAVPTPTPALPMAAPVVAAPAPAPPIRRTSTTTPVQPPRAAPAPVAPAPAPAPAEAPPPAQPTFVGSPAPVPAAPAPTPDQTAAKSLTRSLNAGPPAP